jgi:hypothetical protein
MIWRKSMEPVSRQVHTLTISQAEGLGVAEAAAIELAVKRAFRDLNAGTVTIEVVAHIPQKTLTDEKINRVKAEPRTEYYGDSHLTTYPAEEPDDRQRCPHDFTGLGHNYRMTPVGEVCTRCGAKRPTPTPPSEDDDEQG